MLVLLPPSEGKSSRRRGRPLDLGSLSLPELEEPRRRVLGALAEASSRDDALAVLQVPPSLRVEVERNTRWDSAPAVPVADLYRGVLYEALDLPSLPVGARRRATGRLRVVSAAYGALRLDDRVPPYRTSICARLPVGPTAERVELAAFWRSHLSRALPPLAQGLVVDCRSTTYAAAWRPTGEVAARTVSVRVVTIVGGRRTSVSHMAKHTRGLVTRHLVSRAGRDPLTPHGLAGAVAEAFEVDLRGPLPSGSHALEVLVRS